MGKISKALWILILLTVAFNILFLIQFNFETDSAFYVTLAQEQIRTKSLFPDGMYYSTCLFVLTPNLLVIPFLFLTDNLVLARQSAILLLWCFVYFVLYKLFITKNEKNLVGFILASSLFSVFYITAHTVPLHFHQGAYVCYLLFLLLFHLTMNRIVTEDFYKKKHLVALLFLIILANLGDIRNLLIWGVPGFLAFVLYIYLKSGKKVSLISILKFDICARTLFTSILLAFLFYIVMAKIYGAAEATMGIPLFNDYGKSFLSIINSLFELYGISIIRFSGVGFIKLINSYFSLIFIFVVPVIAIKKYNSVNSETCKFIILFSLISSSVYLLVVFFTGTAVAGNKYLIPVYNNNILLFAVMGSYFLNTYTKRYVSLGILCVLVYVLVNNFYYFYCNKDSLLNQEFGDYANGIKGVTDFLIENDLKYGYATFGNSEEYSVLSNNKVRVRGITLDEGKIRPHYWLTSKRFYEPDYYVGKSFLLLTDSQIKYSYTPQVFVKNDLGEPVKVLRFKKYTVFIYDYNIACKFSSGRRLCWLVKGDKTGWYFVDK